MEQIFKKGSFQIIRIDKQDFMDRPQLSISNFSRVFSENENAVVFNGQTSDELLSDFFYDENDCYLYFLFIGNQPVSTALFSTINGNKHLEIVGTHSDYRTMGYAKMLLAYSFENLATEFDTQIITACVNENNYQSDSLHTSLAKLNGVKTTVGTFEDKKEFRFDVSALNCENENLL